MRRLRESTTTLYRDREIHANVKDLQSTTGLAESLTLQILTRGWISMYLNKVVVDYFSPITNIKRLLLRCIHHFKSDIMNNRDHMCISGIEPSSVILRENKTIHSLLSIPAIKPLVQKILQKRHQQGLIMTSCHCMIYDVTMCLLKLSCLSRDG